MPRGRKSRQKSAESRLKRAVVLLVLIAVSLAAILLLLPERGTGPGPAASGTGGQPAPEQRAGGEQPQQEVQPRREAGPQVSGRRERVLRKARIAVLIDDAGYSLDAIRPFLELPQPIAFSILPNLPYSSECARRIAAAGKELLLHLPMEAVEGNDPGPGAILTSQDDEEIRRLLEQNLAQVPGAVGVNNHMGSKATADERVMNAVMRYLKGRGVFFLDSRTTPKSVARASASRYSVPFIERSVFLDNDPQADCILNALEKGVRLASRDGQAVLIGHVQNPQIVDVLEKFLAHPEAAGVEISPLTALIQNGEARP